MAWFEKEEYGKAIADFDQVIRLVPRDAEAYWKRGAAWQLKGEFDKAIADFNQAIRLDPREPNVYVARGQARVSKGELDKAIIDFNEAIRLDPDDADTFLRGATYGSPGRNTRKPSPTITTRSGSTPRALGCTATGETRGEPRRNSERPLPTTTRPSDSTRRMRARNGRGIAWRAKKEYGKALADYTEAIRLAPKYAWAYNNRAWLWATCADEKYRDGRRAVESAARACELSDWKEASMIDTLAAGYAETGDFPKAVAYQQKANTLYTDANDLKKGQRRLKIYEDKKPYRDEPGTS